MLKFNKICTVFLTVVTVTAMGFPTQAAENTGRGSQGAVPSSRKTAARNIGREEEAYGDTTVSIVESRHSFTDVSFTVPLTVTMAVEEGRSRVYAPNNYTIENAGRGERSLDFAVVGMTFKKLGEGAGFYNTVEELGADSGPQDMVFRIGGVTMPALDKAGAKGRRVELRAAGSGFLQDSGPEGYLSSKWYNIKPGASLNLNPEGWVSDHVERDGSDCISQFEVVYILSPLDGEGNRLLPYAGDDRAEAGLPPLTP